MHSNQRPLSPHLQVYKPQWSSVLSILHRITGLALSAGTVLVVAWLVALAQGAEAFATVTTTLAHPVLLAILVAWTLALFYHLLNGIRHLLWDTGALLELGPARTSGWIVVIAALALTALVWGVAL
jgi:succinate dehydrogenase / fumarate reductase cytochrome b subunit